MSFPKQSTSVLSLSGVVDTLCYTVIWFSCKNLAFWWDNQFLEGCAQSLKLQRCCSNSCSSMGLPAWGFFLSPVLLSKNDYSVFFFLYCYLRIYQVPIWIFPVSTIEHPISGRFYLHTVSCFQPLFLSHCHFTWAFFSPPWLFYSPWVGFLWAHPWFPLTRPD